MPPNETVSVSATIDAPIWRVYQNWRRLERFPAFVPSVKAAKWLSKERLYWCEEYQGQRHEFTYEVKINPAESSLSWRSLSGPENSGTAVIVPVQFGQTRITLTIHFAHEEGFQDPPAVKERHRDFLMSFKRFVETQPSRLRYE